MSKGNESIMHGDESIIHGDKSISHGDEPILNLVSQSTLLTIDLEEFYDPIPRICFDIAPILYMGMVLKEMEFRTFLKTHDWTQYERKAVYVLCSEDAIIPTWAYMLVMSKLQAVAGFAIVGSAEQLEQMIWNATFDQIDFKKYQGSKMVVKGCGKIDVGVYAYSEWSRRVLPFVQSLMFGEPCSTVPVFKRKG